MYCTFLILCALLNTVTGHSENEDAISGLQTKAEIESNAQEEIANKLDMLKKTLVRLTLEQQSRKRQSLTSLDDARQKHRLQRIEKLARDIRNLEDYLHDDGTLDAYFNNLDANVGKKIDDEIQAVNEKVRIMNLKIAYDLKGVDKITGGIETTANKRNVVVGGVVYYMGIGSACTEDVDICRVGRSECRNGICQCEPGLSSDSLRQTCVEKCEGGYGRSYQTVNNYAIRGYNNLELLNVTLEDCKGRCEGADTFVCRSFDYFPDWRSCYLSEKVKSDVEPAQQAEGNDDPNDVNVDVQDHEDGWEYNGAAIHFQRDCRI